MPRTRLFRLTAALVALLTSLSTPALAVAHGQVHAHLAEAHEMGDAAHHGESDADYDHDHDAGPAADHDDSASLHHHDDEHDADGIGASQHDHAHAHQTIDVALTPRDAGHLDDAPLVAVVAPRLLAQRQPVRRIELANARNLALLARPGPDTGPPPSPRAPPIG